MPRVVFTREDVELIIEEDKPGFVSIRRSGASWRDRVHLRGTTIRRWASERANRLKSARSGYTRVIRRLTLDLRSLDLHAEPWEAWLRPALAKCGLTCIVRVSRVIPRVAQVTFTPPLPV